MDAIVAALSAELAAGRELTGAQVAARFNLSERTARRKLQLAKNAATQATDSADDRPAANVATERPAASGHDVTVWGTAITVIVAAIALSASFLHLASVAEHHGQAHWVALGYPVMIDLMIVAATLALLSHRRHGTRAGFFPRAGLVFGVVVSITGNVMSSSGDWVDMVIAALPALLWVITFEILLGLYRARRGGE